MSGHGLFAVLPAQNTDHLQPTSMRPYRHFNTRLADAARGNHDHDSMRTEGEIPQNLFGIPECLLQMQALAQAVGPHDRIVIGQSQLHDGMPTHEAPLTWSHFLAEHSA